MILKLNKNRLKNFQNKKSWFVICQYCTNIRLKRYNNLLCTITLHALNAKRACPNTSNAILAQSHIENIKRLRNFFFEYITQLTVFIAY